MKKTTLMLILVFTILSMFCVAFASNVEGGQKISTNEKSDEIKDKTSQLLEIKENSKNEIEEYAEKYGSDSYGLVAYILNTVRIYSIPCCFAGIAIGAILQYAIGTRRLDMKHKGFKLILSFVTILVVCQVLPLVYTLVVIGWRV